MPCKRKDTMNHQQRKHSQDHISKTIPPSRNWFHGFAARTDDAEILDSCRPEHFSAARLATRGDLFSFTEEERRAHFRRSLRATVATFAAVRALFALFFGLIAACGGL